MLVIFLSTKTPTKFLSLYLTKRKKKSHNKTYFTRYWELVFKAHKEMIFKMFIGLRKQRVIYWNCSAPLISTNASRGTSCVLSPVLTFCMRKNP